MSKKQFNGKGYYIALILCAAAVGIMGYVRYADTGEDAALPQNGTPVAVTDGVQAQSATAATQPATTATTATQPTKARMTTCAPVEGTTVAGYAMEVLSYNQTTRDWRVHNGVDIAAEAGSSVCAAADGRVYTVYDDDQMGTTVVIRHDGGYTTLYSSLSDEVAVAAGDDVTMGQTIGSVGATALMESALGDHLHFSVCLNDEAVDPAEFLAME